MEEYKVIEGGYKVCPDGKVLGLRCDNVMKPVYEKRLKGYQVRLPKHPKKSLTLKNLIATHFIEGFDVSKHFIEFIDGDESNCNVNNLRIVNRYKQTVDQELVTKACELLKDGFTKTQAARKLGVTYSQVQHIENRYL